MIASIKKTGKNLTNPQVGMLATVRNRRALVDSVDSFGGTPEGQLHLVPRILLRLIVFFNTIIFVSGK
ncbi:hypothetical protein [Tolypothrix sp. VBCCA 56010]|uniref:hypothetical protein n=1 Tax=Tolypothrix sp. VBCCA 56010 TaxID=3137731 RepID=UPI003D7D5BD9